MPDVKINQQIAAAITALNQASAHAAADEWDKALEKIAEASKGTQRAEQLTLIRAATD